MRDVQCSGLCLHPRFDTRYPFITVGSEKISRINIVGSLRKSQNLLDPIDFCSHSATIYTKEKSFWGLH